MAHCGQHVSELFPHIARHVDDLCFLKGMHTDGVAHGPATLFLHTGSINLVRPSVGSWVLYGLGTENENLPGFVTIQPSMGNGGPRNFGNAFLPAQYQGTAVGRAGVASQGGKDPQPEKPICFRRSTSLSSSKRFANSMRPRVGRSSR